jgi:hypothetical protein
LFDNPQQKKSSRRYEMTIQVSIIVLFLATLATQSRAANIEYRSFEVTFPQTLVPFYDVVTGTFGREVITPFLTQAWTFRGLSDETKIPNFWAGSCVADLINATRYSTTTDVHVCRKKLHVDFQRFGQHPTSATRTCSPFNGFGFLEQSLSVVASITKAASPFGDAYSLDLTVEEFELFNPPGTPFPNCTNMILVGTDTYDLLNATCYVTQSGNVRDKTWWNGAVTHRIYTTMQVNYDQTAQGGARQALFAGLFLEDPNNSYLLVGSNTPGSTSGSRLGFATPQSVYVYGDELATDPQHDATFCDTEDHRYMDPGIVFIDIGEPYSPATVGDFGSCASINYTEALGLPASTLVYDILNTPNLFMPSGGPLQSDPTPVSGDDVLVPPTFSPTNFLPVNDSGFVWYPPLHTRSLVGSVRDYFSTQWYFPTPGTINPSMHALIFNIEKTIGYLANCTRSGVSGSMVKQIPDGQGGRYISFWVTAHHLQRPLADEEVFMTSTSMQFNIQLDAFGRVVLLTDSRQDSEAQLIGTQDIRGAAAHCPDDQVRLSLTWRIIHRPFANLNIDTVGILRADDIYRYRGGGCYGFPATTNAASDPIDSTFMWDRARSQTQQDDLQLVFNPALMFTAGTNPNSWDPSWALAGHSGTNPCDHPGVSGDPVAYARCRACTICHDDADLGFCRKTDPLDSAQTVPLVGTQLEACVAYCNSTVLPDICYEARPGKLRTVTVSLPTCQFGLCRQQVTILSDCFTVVLPNLFYNECPYTFSSHVVPPISTGHYSFLYDAYDCGYDQTTLEPYRRFDRPCAKITESLRSFVDASPRHTVFPQENTTFGTDNDIALFGQSDFYWEQNLGENGGPAVATFPPGSVVTMGIRTTDVTQRDIIPKRIYKVTVCRVLNGIVSSLSTAISNFPTLSCADPEITNYISVPPFITLIGSNFVTASHTFLADGSATTTCSADPFANTDCVQPQFMPKPAASPTVFTSRSGGAFRMCRREARADFNQTNIYDSNQYVGCDGVGLLSSTVLAQLGALHVWEVYFVEITTQNNFVDTRPIGGRRLLSTNDESSEDTFSLNIISFIIRSGNQTTEIDIISAAGTSKTMTSGIIASIVLACVLGIVLLVWLLMCCGCLPMCAAGTGTTASNSATTGAGNCFCCSSNRKCRCCKFDDEFSTNASIQMATKSAASLPGKPQNAEETFRLVSV